MVVYPFAGHHVQIRMDISPVNVKKSHWVPLAANVTTGEVSILDSLPGTADTCHYIKKFV